jgi:hypothetical protein
MRLLLPSAGAAMQQTPTSLLQRRAPLSACQMKGTTQLPSLLLLLLPRLLRTASGCMALVQQCLQDRPGLLLVCLQVSTWQQPSCSKS